MNQETLLKLAGGRGLTLSGTTYKGGLYRNRQATEEVDIAKENREFLATLAKAPLDLNPKVGDSEVVIKAKKDAHKLIVNALDGDREALRTLNAIRMEQVDNYVKARSNFLRFFRIKTLRDDERPYVENTTQNEIKVTYLSQDGPPKRQKIEVNVSEYPVDLRWLSSKKVNYRTTDIYKGNIATIAQRTFDIGFDMSMKVDIEARKLLTLPVAQGGAFGTFTFAGAKETRIYVPHSAIITSHLPKTNDIKVYKRNEDGDIINPNAPVLVGKFGVPVINEIIQYCDSWGDIFQDGRLVPTGEIIVPSSDIFDILWKLAPGNTNVTETSIQEDIKTKGYTSITHANREWRFTPDVTIPIGTCYPVLNKLPGEAFLKPGLDKEFVETKQEENYEERWQRKVVGYTIINQRRVNALRLTYKQ